jgi:hypothetical protein
MKLSAVAASFLAMGIYNYKRDVRTYFRSLPDGFPVLSIRAWQDALVPIAAIDQFFELQNHLSLEILSLPEADHLQGLKEYSEDYQPRLMKFLERHATKVHKNSSQVKSVFKGADASTKRS